MFYAQSTSTVALGRMVRTGRVQSLFVGDHTLHFEGERRKFNQFSTSSYSMTLMRAGGVRGRVGGGAALEGGGL